jgi:hypothetical protein
VVEDTTAHLPEAVTRTAAPPSDQPSSPAAPGGGRPTGR